MKRVKTSTINSTLIPTYTLILMTTLLLCKSGPKEYQITQEQISVFEHCKALLNLESTPLSQVTHNYPHWNENIAFANGRNLALNSDLVSSKVLPFYLSSIFIFQALKKTVFSPKIPLPNLINLHLLTLNPFIFSFNEFSC